MKRQIIEIEEEKCTGCGQCIVACAEGALAMVNGKAKLVKDIYCDGLGACLGECPEDALHIIEREAPDFDERAVHEHLKAQDKAVAAGLKPAPLKPAPPKPAAKEETLPCGCPGSMTMTLPPRLAAAGEDEDEGPASGLGQWPIKLTLLRPDAPFLKNSDLLLLADCAAAAYPDLHRKLLRGHTVAMGCPKLDDLDAHIAKLTQLLAGGKPRSLTVAHLEVPCCRGFVFAAEQAIARSGANIPLKRIMIARTGEVLEEEEMNAAGGCGCAACS